MSNEQVLVFPACRLEKYQKEFSKRVVSNPWLCHQLFEELVLHGVCHYMDREQAELDPSFKQIIPYCVLRDEKYVFRYQRTKKGGENRLHDKWSVGVGGHINPVDGETGETYFTAMARELSEEVGLSADQLLQCKNRLIGLLYDDSNEVGKVHFGVVHEIETGKEVLSFKDQSISNGYFHAVEDLKQSKDNFENWSRLVIDHLLM